jgi:hypothetical protein
MADLNDKMQELLAECGGDPKALRAAFKKVVGKDGRTSKVRELRAALDGLIANHCQDMTIKTFRREATAAWKRARPDDTAPIANPYLQFCKDNLAVVKASHPALSYKEHRALLTTMWNDRKKSPEPAEPVEHTEPTEPTEPAEPEEPIVEEPVRKTRSARNTKRTRG